MRAGTGQIPLFRPRFLQRRGAIGRRQLVQSLSTAGLRAPSIEVGDANAIEIGRRQRQLVALLRRALPKRPIKIHARAAAIGAGKPAINEDRHADFNTAGTDLVLWDQGIDQRDQRPRPRAE